MGKDLINNRKIKLSNAQIERRLDWLETMITRADVKDLPYLNRTFQMLFDELVNRDLEKDEQWNRCQSERSMRDNESSIS